MKPHVERVTKLDAARRQLRTAVRMFFEDQDTVSVYTLAAAVEGILSGLLKRQGKAHPFRESDLIKEGMEAEFNRILNRPQNFFKHADTDPDDILEFAPIILEYVLFECGVLYQMHTGRALRESWIFFIWFGLHYPDVLNEGPWKAALETVKQQTLTPATARSVFLDIVNRPDLYPCRNTD